MPPPLPADTWLPLLVYDLIKSLVEEDGEALAAVRRCRIASWAVVGYLDGHPQYHGKSGSTPGKLPTGP